MKQVAVIGLGRFGVSLAESLMGYRCQVLAIDSEMGKVKKAQPLVTQAVQLDAREADALKAVGIAEMDAVVVAIGSNQEASMLATMVLKDLGVKTVIAKAMTHLHGRFLEKVGADQVVYPEIDSGKRLGRRLARPNILEQIEFGVDHGVFEITAPPTWAGKTLGDLDVRAKYGLTVLAVKGSQVEEAGGEETRKEPAQMHISPVATSQIREGDVLLVLGHVDDIQKLTK